MPPRPPRAPADAAWRSPGGRLLASLHPCDYDAFLGPPSRARLAAFWALATHLTKGDLSLTLSCPSPRAVEARARLRWRERCGRWRSFYTLGGGANPEEAAFHASFFALRRFLLGDGAIVGVLFANEALRLELRPSDPLRGRYALVLKMHHLRDRARIEGRALQAPSRYQWEAALEPPTNPRARTTYMRVKWGPAGMPSLLRASRGRGLPKSGPVRLHRLVAHLRGDGLLGMQVHHRNHYGLDNREANLLTLTPREHALGLHGETAGQLRFHATFTAGAGWGAWGDSGELGELGHTTPDGRLAGSYARPPRPHDDQPAAHPATSPLAGFGLRCDALRHADALVHLLQLTDRPWTISELATIISMQEGSLRRLVKRLCGFGVVEAIDGTPQRYVRRLCETHTGQSTACTYQAQDSCHQEAGVRRRKAAAIACR